MKTSFIAQPIQQLGFIISDIFQSVPPPRKIYLVSAFVSLQTLIRIKDPVMMLKELGSEVHFTIGIDMGGTSQEVLKELLTWEVDVRIVKNRIPRHTFHPKLYVFEWDSSAQIILGSNNLTDGGFFGNYEGASNTYYSFPEEQDLFDIAKNELENFLEPTGPTTYPLTNEFLKRMIETGAVLSETEIREKRGAENHRANSYVRGKEPIFGTESIKTPPPLPGYLLENLTRMVRTRRREEAKNKRKQPSDTQEEFILNRPGEGVEETAAFFMTLPKLQGSNIPGEGRIPLAALELANDFWGWPYEYSRDVSPRNGEQRIYWNWRPNWRIRSVDNPEINVVLAVRMYLYENSKDFRFYVRPLINAGGDTGDVVRITRVSDGEAEYECVLARKGTNEYQQWINACTQSVNNSDRRFGYA